MKSKLKFIRQFFKTSDKDLIRRHFTDDEIEALKKAYPDHTSDQIVSLLFEYLKYYEYPKEMYLNGLAALGELRNKSLSEDLRRLKEIKMGIGYDPAAIIMFSRGFRPSEPELKRLANSLNDLGKHTAKKHCR